MLFRSVWLAVLAAALAAACGGGGGGSGGAPAGTAGGTDDVSGVQVVELVDVAPVFASLSVDFDMVTTDTQQFVAYYDVNRQMTVAMRDLGSDVWTHESLPSSVGWDSHSDVTLALDTAGYLHLAGNMHNAPLVYFRSLNPLSVRGFHSPAMLGDLESSMTYPSLFLDATGVLHFSYRTGVSGQGTTVWNRYSTLTERWTRITEQGLFNGQGQVNAYHNYEPIPGPDGRFHIVFMWRKTPVANTNMRISHICSADLVNWETYRGEPVSLPVTTQTPGVVVDPVESGNGLINIAFGLGWDALQRPVITYHKYDAQGLSQSYNARLEDQAWVIHQTSQWTDYRWPLDLLGSLVEDVRVDPVELDPQGRLIQSAYHVQHGIKTWVLDPDSLAIEVELDDHPVPVLAKLLKVQSEFPEMTVHLERFDDWYMRWETLPINQDQPYEFRNPEASMLTLYRLDE